MSKYTQEEICESRGRESRYQVMPLDEYGKPSKYLGTDESPINRYALVDMKNRAYYKLEEVEADSYDEAYNELMANVINE